LFHVLSRLNYGKIFGQNITHPFPLRERIIFFLWLNPQKNLVAGKKANEKGGQLPDPLGFKYSAEIS
jgi:hypothetical protein